MTFLLGKSCVTWQVCPCRRLVPYQRMVVWRTVMIETWMHSSCLARQIHYRCQKQALTAVRRLRAGGHDKACNNDFPHRSCRRGAKDATAIASATDLSPVVS